MTDSVLVIRIAGLGLGSLADSRPVALTSRPLQYDANALEGVVADMGEQLSSDISLFGALGSDSTTTFSVLANDQTMALLLARGKIPVRDTNGASVVVTDYVKPTPLGYGDTIISVSDTTNMSENDLVRIGTTVFRVRSVNSTTEIAAVRYYGCADVPIAMSRSGVGVGVEGQTVYNVNANRPNGGAESLPVTISTVPFDAPSSNQETIIFRGIIGKVVLDTSAFGQNQIRVECGSLMAYLKAATFAPPRGPITINSFLPDEANVRNWPQDTLETGLQTGFNWNPKLYGVPYVPGAEDLPVAATVVPLLQFRNGTAGGIGRVENIGPAYFGNDLYGQPQNGYVVTYASRYTFNEDGSGMSNSGYEMSFRDAWYTNKSDGPEIAAYANRARDVYGGVVPTFVNSEYDWLRVHAVYSADVVAESCFVSNTIANLFVDLILGTFLARLDFRDGCRTATEAAWLPFRINDVSEIIDIASLNSFCAGLTINEIPKFFVVGQATYDWKILPYKHDEAKTVGEILEEILKRLGGFLVYDAGRFVFGRWSALPDYPTPVNDTALATPEIVLSFDRNNCVQAVNVSLCSTILLGEIVKTDIPFLNVDLGIGAQGKTINIGHFGVFGIYPQENFTETNMFQTAVNLILRFSQAAATVEVTYRDAVRDLVVGQQVALSSAFLPNPYGGLGVTGATGMVLKAARSWKTPTTKYSILLPGYLNPINRLSVISPAGTVVSTSGSLVTIAPNDFTNPAADASTGAPTTDALAFKYALELAGGALPVQLLDKYGSPYSPPVTDIVTGAGGNTLNCGVIAAVALPDDIIVLDSAPSQPNIAAQWSSFLANGNGEVQGSTAFSYKWVR